MRVALVAPRGHSRPWPAEGCRDLNPLDCPHEAIRARIPGTGHLLKPLCDQYTSGRPAMSATVARFKQGRKQRNATSSKGRQGNEVYRVREHLTEAEIEKLLAALKQNRYGQRDWLIGRGQLPLKSPRSWKLIQR